jgi:hypothetical protein
MTMEQGADLFLDNFDYNAGASALPPPALG